MFCGNPKGRASISGTRSRWNRSVGRHLALNNDSVTDGSGAVPKTVTGLALVVEINMTLPYLSGAGVRLLI